MPRIIPRATDLLFFCCLLLPNPMHLLKPVLLHICSHFPHCTPLSCIQSQDLTKHLHRFWSEPFPQRRNVLLSVWSPLHSAPVCEFLVKVVRNHAALPWEVARKDAENNHPEGPGVQAWFHTKRRCGHFLLALQQGHGTKLWGHVGQRSCDVAYQSASLLGQAKVCQLDLAAVIVQQQDVFRLDITVDQTMAVDELQSTGDLEDTTLYRRFWDTHLEQVGKSWDTAFCVVLQGARL